MGGAAGGERNGARNGGRRDEEEDEEDDGKLIDEDMPESDDSVETNVLIREASEKFGSKNITAAVDLMEIDLPPAYEEQ